MRPLALWIFVGWLSGVCVNILVMSILTEWYPLPIARDASNEVLGRALQQLPWFYAVIPIMAHAAGTFVGCLLVALKAPKHRQLSTWIVCGLFMVGSISVAWLFPLPMAFIIADLTIAYLPVAWFAMRVATAIRKAS